MFFVKLKKATANWVRDHAGTGLQDLLKDHTTIFPPTDKLVWNNTLFSVQGNASLESKCRPMLNPTCFTIVAQRHFTVGDVAFTNSTDQAKVTQIRDANKKFKVDIPIDPRLQAPAGAIPASDNSTGQRVRMDWTKITSNHIGDTDQVYVIIFNNGHLRIKQDPTLPPETPATITKNGIFFDSVIRYKVMVPN
jgi:hypothetical protein